MGKENRIHRDQKLTSSALMALIEDELLALVVDDFYPSGHCSTIADRILSSENIERYTHEVVDGGELMQQYFGVDRLGMPFNLIYNVPDDSDSVLRYYDEALPTMHRLRRICEPYPTPIDKLRLELDELFSQGALIAAFQGRKMLSGIGRISHAGLSQLSSEQPHFDAIPSKFIELDSQFAANVYLKVPEIGGDLELWDVPEVSPLSEMPKDWRAALPASQKLKPLPGQLILFNCRRPHAICSFAGEPRITVQTFIGFQKGKALQLWN